jgi:hypothetical protein
MQLWYGGNGTCVSGAKMMNDFMKDLGIRCKVHFAGNDGGAVDIYGYNFMYIPQLRSYYWLKWHTEGGMIVFEGERDPMYTFWGDVKGSTQYISRSQTMRNKYIVDNSLPIHSQHNYLIKNIGSPVYDKSCNAVILETVGKGGTPT